MPETITPASFDAAAAALAAATAEQRRVRVLGGGTKAAWAAPGDAADLTISSGALAAVREHNVGDLTAVIEAGSRLADVQEQLATEGQMLALDPPLGSARAATIGGLFATGDSGPLRHRYGAPRELIVGVTLALADGTIARAGGKVIKNVAGYDLAKLITGSFGTLGMILSVSVRLHPLPAQTATAVGASADPDSLTAAAIALARAPLELDALDVAWRGGRGGLLARCSGVESGRRARRVAKLMRDCGLEQVDVVTDDGDLWARQRAGQRSERQVLARIATRPTALGDVVRASDAAGATLVGRAAAALCYVEVHPDAVSRLRERLPQSTVTTLLDRPGTLAETLNPWDPVPPAAIALMQKVKARFDPTHTCNHGVFAGGI